MPASRSRSRLLEQILISSADAQVEPTDAAPLAAVCGEDRDLAPGGGYGEAGVGERI